MLRFRRNFLTLLIAACCCMGLVAALPPATAAALPPIPAGCPGSNRDGPPSPAGNGKTVCDTIPAGCPGSSHQGKPKPESQCPYASARDSAAQVAASTPGSAKFKTGVHETVRDVCGGTVDGEDLSVGIAIKIGCKGKGNPIADAIFAVIRILSDGVGLVVIGSIVVGGIQYAGSRGDPQAMALAVGRIRSSLFALVLFIFGYAILNYIIPAGFLG